MVERRVPRVEIDQILWGGPSGEGIVYVVDRLASTVDGLVKLAEKHTELATLNEITMTTTNLTLKNIRDEMSFAKKVMVPVIGFFVVVGISSIILLGRVVSIAGAHP